MYSFALKHTYIYIYYIYSKYNNLFSVNSTRSIIQHIKQHKLIPTACPGSKCLAFPSLQYEGFGTIVRSKKTQVHVRRSC